jgi:hypothetical protein
MLWETLIFICLVPGAAGMCADTGYMDRCMEKLKKLAASGYPETANFLYFPVNLNQFSGPVSGFNRAAIITGHSAQIF